MLALAEDETQPLLERVKFLAIFASNLDEFYMVRVAGLKRRADMGLQVHVGRRAVAARGPGAARPSAPANWSTGTPAASATSSTPALEAEGIHIRRWDDLDDEERAPAGRVLPSPRSSRC